MTSNGKKNSTMDKYFAPKSASKVKLSIRGLRNTKSYDK